MRIKWIYWTHVQHILALNTFLSPPNKVTKDIILLPPLSPSNSLPKSPERSNWRMHNRKLFFHWLLSSSSPYPSRSCSKWTTLKDLNPIQHCTYVSCIPSALFGQDITDVDKRSCMTTGCWHPTQETGGSARGIDLQHLCASINYRQNTECVWCKV